MTFLDNIFEHPGTRTHLDECTWPSRRSLGGVCKYVAVMTITACALISAPPAMAETKAQSAPASSAPVSSNANTSVPKVESTTSAASSEPSASKQPQTEGASQISPGGQQSTGTDAVAQEGADDGFTNPYAGREDIIPAGRTLFNIHCSHCHGPNAFQGERRRDLRRLSRRYRDNLTEVFITTAWNGRPTKGMPPWKNVIEKDELWRIFTFLSSVQDK